MMEREFIAQKNKELQIKRYLENKLSKVGLSEIRLKKIPLGEKIIISASRPSLIVGSKGTNIKDLTNYLKKEFKLENPQIEINKIQDIFLDANAVAERIATSLERFGSARFKGIGHKIMENVINAGALGVEILISGKIPGARAKSWRFYRGYLKKCGDVSLTGVKRAKKVAALKSGVIGIKVSIMPPDVKLPDKIIICEEPIETVEEVVEEKVEKKKPKAGKKRKAKEKKTKLSNESEKLSNKDEKGLRDSKLSSGNEKGLEESKSPQRSPGKGLEESGSPPRAVKEKKEKPKEKPEVKEVEPETPIEKKPEEIKEDKEDIPLAEDLIQATKEKFSEEKQEKKEEIIEAEELIKETKEKFEVLSDVPEAKPLNEEKKEPKKITAEEIIEKVKQEEQ